MVVKAVSYKKSFLIIVLIANLLCIYLACTSLSSLKISNTELTAREFTTPANIKSSMAALTGSATNIKNTPARNCLVTVRFFDSNKNELGTASTARESLEPGETWNFTVQLTGSDAWKARSYDIRVSSQ